MLQIWINKLKSLFTKKNLFYIFLFLGIFFLSKELSFAAEEPTTASDKNDIWHTVAEAIDILLRIASSLLAVMSSLVALLLSPKWTNGSVIGLHLYMKEIWILVSNIVYFIFAFLIIVIALMNIVWKWWDGPYQLKTALPKFIVGILLVPFSWFIVQFILSISAVLSVSVLTIPYETFQGHKAYQNKYLEEYKICTGYTINLTWTWCKTNSTTQNTNNDDYDISKVICCTWETMNIKDFLEWRNADPESIYGIIYLYTYAILNPHKTGTFNSADVVSMQTFLSVIQTVIFDILFIVVYFILIFALFLALLVRGFWLWLYIMASPFLWLGYFFWKNWWGGGDGALSKFKLSEIIHLALIPVYASAALSFGFLFLLVASNGIRTTDSGWINTTILKDNTISFAWIDLTIEGLFNGSNDGKDKGFFRDMWSPIAGLILEIFWLGILWIALLAALSKPETTKSVVEPIKKFGETVWQTAMKLPTYVPILPGWLSAQSLESLATTSAGILSEKARWRWQEWWQDLFWGKWDHLAKMREANEALERDVSKRNAEKFKEAFFQFDNLTTLRTNENTIESLNKLLKKADPSAQEISTSSKETDFIEALKTVQRKLPAQLWGFTLFDWIRNANQINRTLIEERLSGKKENPLPEKTEKVNWKIEIEQSNTTIKIDITDNATQSANNIASVLTSDNVGNIQAELPSKIPNKVQRKDIADALWELYSKESDKIKKANIWKIIEALRWNISEDAPATWWDDEDS